MASQSAIPGFVSCITNSSRVGSLSTWLLDPGNIVFGDKKIPQITPAQ